MAENECRKIIDQVVDPDNLNEQCRQHIKGCKECAAALACLVWLKTRGSPTADLKPSQAFLGKIESGIGGNSAGNSGSAATGSKTLLAVAISVVITAAVAISFIAFNSSPADTMSGSSSISAGNEESQGPAAEAESEILNRQQSAPILKFTSPADDVD